MKLTDEQKQGLTPEMIAKLEADDGDAGQSTKPKEGEVPNLNPGEDKSVNTGGNNQELIDGIVSVFDERQAKETNKALNILWKQQLSANTSNVPGLEDYLNDEDEYGGTRMDKLNGIEDFEERTEMLSKLTKRFASASTASTGTSTPSAPRKQTQVEKDNEDRYNEVTEKFDNGEYGSIHEFQQEFFDTVSKELDSAN